MVSWEGQFGWQGHALTGRPDFLNYLNAGDVTWEALWEFYGRQPVPPEAVRSLTRLFHLFHSSEYDRAGCWLDPEGEIRSRLAAWAAFAVDHERLAPLAVAQADLSGLVAANLVTPLYFQAVYLVFMETRVDRAASHWSEPASDGQLKAGEEFPEPAERLLPVYHPGSARHSHLVGDAVWSAALRALVASYYLTWNTAYAASLPDSELEEELTMVGGEG